MRYLVMLKAAQPAGPPPEGLMESIMQLGAEATAAGALLDTAGLAPGAAASRVELSSGHLNVVDGPFAEAKEFISYAIYDVRSREEAVEWTSRFMRLHAEHWPGWDGTAEVIKVFGPEDIPQVP